MTNIKLHEKSEEFLRTVFDRYEHCEMPVHNTGLVGRFVIHMYAEADTREGEEVDGYYDSLFFRADIYDTANLKKYSIGRRDGVSVRGDVPVSIRIFKDGSTAVFGTSDFEISTYQCLEITPVGYFGRLREEYELKN